MHEPLSLRKNFVWTFRGSGIYSACQWRPPDSGGVQKEAYWFCVPCITLRENTGLAETVKDKWNVLVSADKERIKKAIKDFSSKAKQHNYFGDGKVASKTLKVLVEFL